MPSRIGESRPTYLDTQLAMLQIGDVATMHGMLVMLEETLAKDIPLISDSLAQGNVAHANSLLHPLKGFLPIFCNAQLCDNVSKVEGMSKGGSASAVGDAYGVLRPELEVLLDEVADYLRTHDGT